MSEPVPALRGLLANIDAGLVLLFQFNPANTTTTKAVNYSVTDIPGWDHPDIVFESGGAKRIKFDLLFDTSVKDSIFTLLAGTAIGTEAVKAVLESFFYPQRDLLSLVGGVARFKPPPSAILVLGPRFFSGVLEGELSLQDALFDTFLTPNRLFTGVNFLVREEGTVNDLSVARRNSLAKIVNPLSALRTISETFR